VPAGSRDRLLTLLISHHVSPVRQQYINEIARLRFHAMR
jgi:hypothetical protein